MSSWRKALKNKRTFDARYFLNERVEDQKTVENSVQQEEIKTNFHDFSFDSWLTEAEDIGADLSEEEELSSEKSEIDER